VVENASMDVCTSTAVSRLARVLLNTQLKTTLKATATRTNKTIPEMPPPPEEAAHAGTRNWGRCQNAHRTPRTRDAVRGTIPALQAGQREAAPTDLLEQRAAQDHDQDELDEVGQSIA
jgi:hypothetical protein